MISHDINYTPRNFSVIHNTNSASCPNRPTDENDFLVVRTDRWLGHYLHSVDELDKSNVFEPIKNRMICTETFTKVQWDKDVDTRVLKMLDVLIEHDLGYALECIKENKGVLYLQYEPSLTDYTDDPDVQIMYFQNIRGFMESLILKALGDVWKVEMVKKPSPEAAGFMSGTYEVNPQSKRTVKPVANKSALTAYVDKTTGAFSGRFDFRGGL
jgi:hypothetical protein